MKNLIALFYALILCAPFSAAADLSPDDFAGAMVYSGKEGSLLSLEIPAEVYRGIRRHDTGDIRIFDAEGQSVPFAIIKRPAQTFTPPPEKIPFFAWDGGTENLLPADTDIEINTRGTVLKIKNQTPAPRSPKTFLADLTALEYVPLSLRIITDNKGANFNTPLTIYYSADLSNWKLFDKRQTIASFASPALPNSQNSGGTVEDTVSLPALSDIKNIRYLLVRFENNAPLPLEMIARFPLAEKPAAYHEVKINGVKSADGKKVNYNTNACYPAETVDFVLAAADSIEVIIKNRYDEKADWKTAAAETLFRYNTQDGAARNRPLAIASSAPLWELEARGEFLFSSAPELVIRFCPREIVFPARGKGPWTLAYGNADAAPPEAQPRIPEGVEFERAVFSGTARYAERTSLAAPAETNTREIILWAFLGAVVIVLSLLAVRIAKSMRA